MVSRQKRFYLWWYHLTSRLGVRTVGRWMVYSALVGAVGGLGAILFNVIYEGCNELMMKRICHFEAPVPGGEDPQRLHVRRPAEASRRAVAADTETDAPEAKARSRPNWWILIVPAVGGLVSGFLVYRLAPEGEGDGADAAIEAFHRARGVMRARTPWVKILASSVTIGSGGSAGREGPIAQIGAGFGSMLAGWLGLSDRERRILVLAGIGAGVGSIFRAPLGGALFATEVLYREAEFEYEALIPAFIASIVGYSVYCPLSATGWGVIFELPAGGFGFDQPALLLLYGLLGPLLAFLGYVYVKTYHWMRSRVFGRLRIPRILKPAVGGLAVGLLGCFLPEVLGMGYGYVQQAIEGNLPLRLMVLIALGKIVATALTVGSGGSGGVFAPSLVIGGMLGGAFGALFVPVFPSVEPGAFVLVGMAGFFAGTGKVPISAMLMVSEMTVGYGLLVPLMLVVAVSYALAGERVTLYEKQVARRVDSPAHVGDFIVDILETIKVGEAYRRQPALRVVGENAPLEDVLHLTTETAQSCFPVVSDQGEMTGILFLDDLRSAYFEPELFPLVIARDIAVSGVPSIFVGDSLSSALRKLMESGYVELPVVEEERPRVVVGMLSRQDLILAYHRKVRAYLSTRSRAPGRA